MHIEFRNLDFYIVKSEYTQSVVSCFQIQFNLIEISNSKFKNQKQIFKI